jgi:hypothetical protein
LQNFLYEYPSGRYHLEIMGAVTRKISVVGSEDIGWIHLAHGQETVAGSIKLRLSYNSQFFC